MRPRSHSAASACAARMSWDSKSGKSAQISASVIPAAKYSRISRTVILRPRIHGFPALFSGLTAMRSEWSIAGNTRGSAQASSQGSNLGRTLYHRPLGGDPDHSVPQDCGFMPVRSTLPEFQRASCTKGISHARVPDRSLPRVRSRLGSSCIRPLPFALLSARADPRPCPGPNPRDPYPAQGVRCQQSLFRSSQLASLDRR